MKDHSNLPIIASKKTTIAPNDAATIEFIHHDKPQNPDEILQEIKLLHQKLVKLREIHLIPE